MICCALLLLGGVAEEELCIGPTNAIFLLGTQEKRCFPASLHVNWPWDQLWPVGYRKSKVLIVLTLENPENSSLDFFLSAYDWSNDTEGLGDDSEALGTTVQQE